MTPNSSLEHQISTDGSKPKEVGSEIVTDGDDGAPSNHVEQSTVEYPSVKESYGGADDCPSSPQVHSMPYQQAYPPHLTPQPGAGYYLYGNPQVTPEPPSPAAQGYDITSFLQQQAAFGVHPGNPFGTTGQYGGIPQAPLSPGRTVGLIPPASPLFPRPAGTNIAAASFDQNQLDSSVLQRIQGPTPASPSVTFMSASGASAVGFSGGYSGYGAGDVGNYATVLNGSTSIGDTATSPDQNCWGERNNAQAQYHLASPRLVPGLPGGYHVVPRATSGNRSYSFDETLPHSVLDQQDQVSVSYTPYANTQITTGNPPFVLQQPWAYGVSDDMYNSPQSPLQQRQNSQMHSHFSGSHAAMGPTPLHMGPYGGQTQMSPYYPATSPGPPIQTTASNKGPDGANLFIFHIPNHFTNLDMYRLFCHYGNLLSVRIMIEKDTGRSRGFGFVSYDSSESAALAIKELNGFAIGNKRLKVQHKQIRGDSQRNNSFGHPSRSGGPIHVCGGDALCPGTELSPTPWYDADEEAKPAAQARVQGGKTKEALVGEINDVKTNASLPTICAEQQGVQVGISPLGNLGSLRNALTDAVDHTHTVE